MRNALSITRIAAATGLAAAILVAGQAAAGASTGGRGIRRLVRSGALVAGDRRGHGHHRRRRPGPRRRRPAARAVDRRRLRRAPEDHGHAGRRDRQAGRGGHHRRRPVPRHRPGRDRDTRRPRRVLERHQVRHREQPAGDLRGDKAAQGRSLDGDGRRRAAAAREFRSPAIPTRRAPAPTAGRGWRSAAPTRWSCCTRVSRRPGYRRCSAACTTPASPAAARRRRPGWPISR